MASARSALGRIRGIVRGKARTLGKSTPGDIPRTITRSIVSLFLLSLCAADVQAAIISVNSTGDTVAVDGYCTLREAITAINNGASVNECEPVFGSFGTNDSIGFAIDGAADGCTGVLGVCTIKPGSSLPTIAKTVTIDGYSQYGASPNTNSGATYPDAEAINAEIRIEIDGQNAGSSALGIYIGNAAGGSTVQGLSIINFGFQGGGTGIVVDGQYSQIYGNFIGVHADGTTAGGNAVGLNVYRNNQVGSTTISARRNLIAGNSFDILTATGSQGNVIAGNLIGTDRTGTVSLQPSAAGTGCILLKGYSNEISSNVIAGCDGSGLRLWGAQNTTVRDNAIGIGVGGMSLGNSSYGMLIENDSGRPATINSIYGNGIANNVSDGIIVLANSYGSPTGNNIGSNSIFNNGRLGINLAPDSSDSVTINDALDADSGPNGLQNYPVITSATLNSSGAVVITFTLDSAAPPSFNQFSVKAFSNDACNPSGHGEGRYSALYNYTTVNTDATGHASGTITLSAPLSAGWGPGKWVTLLAHDVSANNTSEYSTCMQATTAAGCAAWPAKETGHGTGYMKLQDAYDYAAQSLTSFGIYLQSLDFAEDVVLDSDAGVVIAGGWNCGLTEWDPLTFSTIQGSLTITGGSATVENLILM